MKEIISIVVLIVVSLCLAFAASFNSYQVNGTSMIMHCWLISFGVHFIVFVPSYMLKTERFFDLTGMLAFLGIVIYILFFRFAQDLQITGLLITALVSIWTLRLGLFLFFRICQLSIILYLS